MKASRCRTVAALLAVTASAVFAQPSDSLRADSAFRRQDWRATADLYGRIAARSPASGYAWFRVGVARHALGEIEPAIAAYERALALQFQPAFTTLRLARVHAVAGNLDRSFEYLDRLVPTRAVPVAILDTIADLAPARRDPRYRQVVERMNALRYPCRAMPEAHQFDFWIGDWIVTPWPAAPGPNTPTLGTNRIESILESCALLENWAGGGGGGGAGKSINFFDTNRKEWRQIWVADGGGSLDYAGAFRDGVMRFEGWTLGAGGVRVLQRMTFFPIHKDTVRQLMESSADSGRTWLSRFDGRYTRRR